MLFQETKKPRTLCAGAFVMALWRSKGERKMRALIQQYIQAYALPVILLLILLSTSMRLSGFKAFGRMGLVVAGVLLIVTSTFGGYPAKVAPILFSMGAFAVGVFGYFLYVDPESKRRR